MACTHIEGTFSSLFFAFSLPEDNLDYNEIISQMDWLKKPALPVAPQLVKVKNWSKEDVIL